MAGKIKIIDYRPEHQPYFEAFNRAWIEEMFTMEPVDEFVLTDPEEAILKNGGCILMAEYNGVIAGTVGLRKVDAVTFEFTKMAVDKNFRRLGIAEAISYASFKKAKQLGAKQIILYSNKRNAGAVKLYEKIGFRHLPVEPGVYKRADVKMIIPVDDAVKAARLYEQRMLSGHTRIIEADVTHAAIIATIGKKSFRHAFENIFKSRDELLEYLEYTYDPVKLVKSLRKENNTYLVAYVNGQPAGFVKLKKHSLNELIESTAQLELQKIYVLPEFQARGVGSHLMEKVKELATDIGPDVIWLDTHIQNAGAIRFYERNGFKKIGNYFFTIGSQVFEYYVMEYGLPADAVIRAAGRRSSVNK